MKRLLVHGLVATIFTGTVAAITSACTHNDSSLFVQNVLYPTPVTAGQTCIYTADPNQTHLSTGTLDVGLGADQYYAWFLLGNQLVPQGNQQQVRTETSDINVEGAIVRVTDAAGNQLTTYTYPTSGTVYASTGTVPGYASVSAVIVDQATVRSLGVGAQAPRKVVTYTKFYGKTLGGTYIESNEFLFPIDVCYGCLVGVTAADLAAGTCSSNPPDGGSSTSSNLPTPCIYGQDTVLDCSQCVGNPVCTIGAANNGG